MDKLEENFRKNPTVNVAFIGYKEKDGKTLKDKKGNPIKAYVFGVEKKKSEMKLDEHIIIPKCLDGMPTDVIEIGPLFKRNMPTPADLQKEYDEMCGALSCGHKDSTAGTISCIVFRKVYKTLKRSIEKDISFFQKIINFFKWLLGMEVEVPLPPIHDPSEEFEWEACLLGNNHVLFQENSAKIGDAIVQPGPYDGGKRIVAEACAYVPIEDGCIADAAIAKLKSGVKYTPTIMGFPKYKGETDEAIIGETVMKIGRTTGYTEGVVISDNAMTKIWYDIGLISLKEQIVIRGKGFSDGGDSGSAILNKLFKLLGILVGGNDEITIAAKAGNIAKLLGVYYKME